MNEENQINQNLRLFIAIDLEKNLCSKLSELQKQISPDIAKIKWVEKENFHITLKFLGDVEVQKIPEIKDKLSSLKFKGFISSVNQIGFFPSDNFIKTIWFGLMPHEKIFSLHEKIDSALSEIGFEKESSFQSHATFGRVKKIHNKIILIEKIQYIQNIIKGEVFMIDSFCLKKSTLTKKGPIYENIAVFK
ncbi:MAG: RNA 2',3'-cyclic phosphodiesterase [Candidatus Aenigmarchaeota archaeon]|nr:RNA 2',3'-cyclic phosphodiesterase [Candidatus Aenigmarchaeota archaeon]